MPEQPLKALFLDLDETLCDTSGANRKALAIMAKQTRILAPEVDAEQFSQRYLLGIYRQLEPEYQALFASIKDEGTFRIALVKQLLIDLGMHAPSQEIAQQLQQSFDQSREQFFDFFPGIKALLNKLRKKLCLVVITNGPEFSQQKKIDAVQLHQLVDHIIIGGQEPEQKPAVSIFRKALSLAQCQAQQTMHIGDSLSADIAGANSSGITSVWISHGKTLDNSAANPDYVLESPLELQQFLARFIAF